MEVTVIDKKILLLMVGVVFALAGVIEQNVWYLEGFVLLAGIFSFLVFREHKVTRRRLDTVNKIIYGTASLLSMVVLFMPVALYLVKS